MTSELDEAVRESNLIEGEPPEGDSFQRHLLGALMARTAAEHGHILHPRVLHLAMYRGMYDHAGQYTRYKRFVNKRNGGQHHFPPPEAVGLLMQEWWNGLDCTDPWRAHCDFESIHPFEDGNGRVGRCVLWNMEMLEGKPITVIRYDERFAYYDSLDEGRRPGKGGSHEWIRQAR